MNITFTGIDEKTMKRVTKIIRARDLDAAREQNAKLAARCYYPTYITGTKIRLAASSISARCARNAGPEESN